jgi:hypothetical protein
MSTPGAPLDALSQLIMQLPQGGAPTFNPKAAPAIGSTEDLEAKAAQPRVAQQAIQPSDDPAITSARQQLNTSQDQIQGSLGRMTNAQQQIAAVPPVNLADHQPTWKDRLLGGVVGTLAGINDPSKAAPVAHDFAYRGLERADAQRQRTLAPLLEQLKTERESLPLYKDSADTSWKQYEAASQDRNAARLQEGTDARAKYEGDIADIRREVAKNNLDVAGQKIDMSLKRLDEKSKNDAGLLDVKQQLLDLKQRTASGDKPATKQQFAARDYKLKAGLAAAEKEYTKEVSGLDPKDTAGQKDALDRLNNAKQQEYNAYDAATVDLGGTPGSQAAPNASAPVAGQAQPAKAGAIGKSDAIGYLKTAGWDGKGTPSAAVKDKARALAKKDGKAF